MNLIKFQILFLFLFSLGAFANSTDELLEASFAGDLKKAKLAIKKRRGCKWSLQNSF